MARQFFFKAMFTILFIGAGYNAAPAIKASLLSKRKVEAHLTNPAAHQPDSGEINHNASGDRKHNYSGELTIKKIEELAEIHRFHKERVRKHKNTVINFGFCPNFY